MNKAKKIFAILMSVFMLTLMYVGCPNTGTEPDTQTTDNGGSGNNNPVVVPPSANNASKIASLQAQIDSTPAGGTVQLSLGRGETLEGLDSEHALKINKPITVNASAVTGSDKGIALEVAHNISSNVSLKGFQSSSLKISSSSLASLNIGRGAIENENGGTFKNFGDGALPLMLDGCSFTEFKAESDVAVFFEGEKSAINELEIMKGEGRKDFEGNAVTEDVKFTFADMSGDMAAIGKMIVDKGIDDVNLVGGQFGDVEFKDRPADSEMNFRYETKSEDQFADTTFLNKDFIEKRDITVADYDTTNTAGGVYKYTMSRDQFDYLNGAVSIVFLTDAQAAVMDNQVKPSIESQEINGNTYSGITGLIRGHDQDWGAVILPETPAYTMSLMGDFVADSTEDGVHAVHGSESHYMANARMGYVWIYKQVYLDHYQTYSKDAVVVEIGDSEVTYYVNTAAIRKSDLLIGAWPHIAADGTVEGGIAGSGSKLSVIDLSDYKPYFVVNHRKLEIAKCIEAYELTKMYEPIPEKESLRDQLQGTMYNTLNDLGCLNESTNIKGSFSFPLDPEAGFFDCGTPDYIVYGMTEASYPTEQVADVSIPVPNDTIGRTYVDVYYWENGSFPATPKTVILGTIDPWLDDWYYFTKENCSDDSYLTVAESMQDATNQWIADLDGFRSKLWAKPKEKVNVFAVKFVSDDMYRIQHSTNDPMGDLTEFQYSNTLNITTEQQYVSLRDLDTFFNGDGPQVHDGSMLTPDWKNAKIYKVYDLGKDPVVESQFSEPVAPSELKNLKDGDTIYLVKPYVILNKVSNGSGTSFGSIEVFGFHNGSNETVSLYDMPEYANLNWYKDASLAADKKWTIDELNARSDAEVFFEQTVTVHEDQNDTTGTKKSYDEFKTLLAGNDVYYFDADNKGTKITIETRSDEGYPLTSDNSVRFGSYDAYKYLSDKGKDELHLSLIDLGVDINNGNYYATDKSVTEVLAMLDEGWKAYSSWELNNRLLTRTDFEILEYCATIYILPTGFNGYVFNLIQNGALSITITGQYLSTYCLGNSDGMGYFTDASKTTKITLENMEDILHDGDNVYSFNLGNVATVRGDLSGDFTKNEIQDFMYVLSDGITVPFNGTAYGTIGNNPQYLFYKDEQHTQPITGDNPQTQFNGGDTLYAEKVNAIGVAHRIVSVPDTAIQKYLAAGANFYSDRTTDAAGNYIFNENDKLTTMQAITAAFTANGKIYLEEDIITEPGSYQPNGNYNYYVVTVYDLDVSNDQGTTMFAPKFNQDYAGYSYYTDASGDNRIDNPTFTNGDNIIYVAHTYQFNDYRAWEQGGEMAYSVVKKTSEVVALLQAAGDTLIITANYSSDPRLTTLDEIKAASGLNIYGLYTYYDLDNLTEGNPTAVKVTKNELESGIGGYFFTDTEKTNQIENSSEWVAAIVAGTSVYHSNNP
ncbi:MAG: hypothetical protein IKQ61_10805 [Spirochaetales bacterium]|nr:hypothetical protein [Spirochaetales bacterium]